MPRIRRKPRKDPRPNANGKGGDMASPPADRRISRACGLPTRQRGGGRGAAYAFLRLTTSPDCPFKAASVALAVRSAACLTGSSAR